MKDMVAACAAGKADGYILLDLNDLEDKEGEADVPVAYMPSLNRVGLLQMDGQLTPEEFEKAFNLAIEGCKRIYALQKEALKAKYLAIKEAVEEAEQK